MCPEWSDGVRFRAPERSGHQSVSTAGENLPQGAQETRVRWPFRAHSEMTSKEPTMIVDYILGGAVTLGLLVYLAYALIRPERF